MQQLNFSHENNLQNNFIYLTLVLMILFLIVIFCITEEDEDDQSDASNFSGDNS